jgi:hypothetical protein
VGRRLQKFCLPSTLLTIFYKFFINYCQFCINMLVILATSKNREIFLAEMVIFV